MPPLVSIGLPVYNGERFLRQAVESILGQTFADLELILCDNASTDSTFTPKGSASSSCCRSLAGSESACGHGVVGVGWTCG